MDLFSKEERERYSRQLLLPQMAAGGQEQLKKARVLVVGAGGLGCPALQYLAAAGIGTLGIVDGDQVEVSNLHRQLLFTWADTGRNKALAAAEKLALINPFTHVIHHPFFLDAYNASGLVASYDLVIDGSDNFSTRYLVNDACVLTGRPFIYAALHRFELQLAVFNLGEGPTYRCLYPEPPAEGEMPSCAEAGIIGALPGMAGTLQALEAIKILTGMGRPLSGKLLIMDLLTHGRQVLDVPSVPENRKLSSRTDAHPVPPNLALPARTPPETDMEQVEQWMNEGAVQLIDVRSRDEFETFRLDKGEVNIPLDRLASRQDLLNRDKYIVTICLSGIRSRTAAALLKRSDDSLKVYTLKGGLNACRLR